MSSRAWTRTTNPSVNSRMLCQLSYAGSTSSTVEASAPPAAFDGVVEVLEDTGCWVWMGAAASNGYGSIHVDGRTRSAHKFAYELLVGPVPAGLTLDHLCHTADPTCPGGQRCWHRLCVNPAHLEPVTMAENLDRSPAFGANKTECPDGHPLTEANTCRNSKGQRYCRACHNAARRRRRAERREAAA